MTRDRSTTGIGSGPASQPPLRERLRARTGLSERQWTVLISLVLFAPYPVFVLIYLTYAVNETLFLVGTIVYSVIAAVANFAL